MLQNNPELKSKIDQLWNKFWAGGISNPLTAIEQITYLLFMKRLDELDQKKQADAEWTGENIHFQIRGQLDSAGIPRDQGSETDKYRRDVKSKSAPCAGANSSACRPRRCSSMCRARSSPSSRT